MSGKIDWFIKDTLLHKSMVIDSGMIMVEYLFENGDSCLAKHLLQRIVEHDNSKFTDEELFSLASLDDNTALKDPNSLLSDEQKRLVEIHWKNNRHHPEYFNDVSEMEEVDILEMVCDWHARSRQYHTDLMEFVKVRQNNRFHFPEPMFERIIKYCRILLGDDVNIDVAKVEEVIAGKFKVGDIVKITDYNKKWSHYAATIGHEGHVVGPRSRRGNYPVVIDGMMNRNRSCGAVGAYWIHEDFLEKC